MERLGKIEEKIDIIQEKISEINSTLAAQHESLKLHIKRTNLLEQTLEPIKKHVNKVEGVLKFIIYVSAITGIVETVIKIKNG